MTSAGAAALGRVRLSESFGLPCARSDAFGLFTARGEMRWVDDWQPEFFVDVVDDAEVGTVFRTRSAGYPTTTWVVVDCVRDERIAYARIEEHGSAGMVIVTLRSVDGGCRVTVDYDLTSTEPRSGAHLARLADSYSAYIASWREAIVGRVVAP